MQPVEYAVATLSDSGDIVHLLARVFSQSEPPAVAMGLSVEDMEQFLGCIVPTTVPDGLTVVARNQETGTLAGVLLTDDFAMLPDVDPSQISPKFLPIFAMLERLDEQFRRGREISAGEYLHLIMLAVDARFAGGGIGQGLVEACVDNGSRKGYRMALTEATGRVSQHIFRKHGFAERFSVAYQDFVYEDKVVFASMREHERAILMDRLLA